MKRLRWHNVKDFEDTLPKKNNVQETCERCGKKKKKQVSDVAAANSLDSSPEPPLSTIAKGAIARRFDGSDRKCWI